MGITASATACACYTDSMTDQPQEAPLAPHDLAVALNTTPATPARSAASDASAEPLAALADGLRYTLTVGQARELFATRGRKIPAERTLQNYCIEGVITAQKIRTTYGAEWLINDESLDAFINQQPRITTAGEAPPAPHDLAVALNKAAATSAPSDASVALVAAPIGERRSLAEVLIENAKLFAQVEGREQVIVELKDDRSFLREEVREARKTRDDVKHIATRMLDTLENMAVGGKMLRSAPKEPLPVDHQDL